VRSGQGWTAQESGRAAGVKKRVTAEDAEEHAEDAEESQPLCDRRAFSASTAVMFLACGER